MVPVALVMCERDCQKWSFCSAATERERPDGHVSEVQLGSGDHLYLAGLQLVSMGRCRGVLQREPKQYWPQVWEIEVPQLEQP